MPASLKRARKLPSICPECNGTNLVSRPQEKCLICTTCGFVVSKETIRHCSKKAMKVIHNLHSGPQNTAKLSIDEENCKNLTLALERLKNTKIHDSQEKNLVIALEQITKMAVSLALSTTTLEHACLVYKVMVKKELIKGRSIKALAATAIYIASKESDFPLTIKRIANASGISHRKVSRFYRTITRQTSFGYSTTVKKNYIPDLSTRLSLSEKTATFATTISNISRASKLGAGKDPIGIASAAIYLSSLIHGQR